MSNTASSHATNSQRLADVLVIAVVIGTSIGGLSLLHSQPVPCGALMAGVLGLALWRWHQPLDVLLVCTGLVVGPVLEVFATGSGLWTYPHPSVGNLPVFIFLLWPAFPLCLWRLTHALLPQPLPHQSSTTHLLLGLSMAALEVPLLCALGTQQPLITTACMLALLVFSVVTAPGPHTWLMLFISGVVGPVVETVPVHMGAWSYPNPTSVGLPLWLPAGYAVFGLALVHLAQAAQPLLQRVSSRTLAAQA